MQCHRIAFGSPTSAVFGAEIARFTAVTGDPNATPGRGVSRVQVPRGSKRGRWTLDAHGVETASGGTDDHGAGFDIFGHDGIGADDHVVADAH
jgi:hypothetical protein